MTKNNNLENTIIHYTDYLGEEHRGKVVYIEPYRGLSEGEYLCYIYDEETEANDKVKELPNGSSFYYAEIRISTQIYLDEDF